MDMKMKKIISALLISATLAGTAVPITAEPKDAIISITFDDGNGYDLNGAVLEDGRNGKALSLDGISQYSEITDTSKLNSLTDEFSISVWFYPKDNEAWERIYDIGTGIDKYIFLTPSTSFSVGKPRFVVKNNNVEQIIDSSRDCRINQWNNIVVTRKNGLTIMYLNGVEAGRTTAITYNFADIGATTQNYLGKSIYENDPKFNGMIDDFEVYDKALTGEEIKEMAGDVYSKEIHDINSEEIIENGYGMDINTQFYDSVTNRKIFSFKNGQTVKAETIIKNLREEDCEINIKTSVDEKNIKINSEETYIFTEDFAGDNLDEYKIIVKDSVENKEYDAGCIIKTDSVIFPDPSPSDSSDTTEGAHDPSIFKDPVSGKYYAYSSHNQIFESEDLINWIKHNVNDKISVPASNKEFIEKNYTDATANGTYWAPDVIYVPDDTDGHPYWMYVSVSCGLGGRNSVIGLVKSTTPDFWVSGDVMDCGVVLASKENSAYSTNAIDANIYTDSDGKKFFVWGSFWGGVRMAELGEDGRLKDVEYTSDATILESSKKVGKTVYSTHKGVAGPEGPWVTENDSYRYMFTSYGWLGSNYNVRIARASKEQSMSDILSNSAATAFKDYNNKEVGSAYNSKDNAVLWGYKLIGSHQLGDGIKYVGQGHNSVINDNGDWYFVDHCRKVAESVAYLQVRKMLWTEDGWPVVSPLVYAGEKEQIIPEKMLIGTWDLTSVGHTIVKNNAPASSSVSYKESDLPVLSSGIVIEENNQLGNGLGTWEYDGDHTITITFAKDGDESKYEFYKAGDVMKLFVLTGYDKDKRESALVMTGTDNKGITQFAKKNNAMASYTDKVGLTPAENTTETFISKSVGGNPALGFDEKGNILYAGDPAAFVDGDTVYLYAGHDTAANESYVMPEWVVYKSTDMINWEYKGVAMKAGDVSWRNEENAAWAGQVTKYNDKYYLYFCTWDKTSEGKQSIGVAVADKPEGPFKDIGKPLVKGTDTTDQTSDWNDIDPTVWIETVDGVEHRYLAWGNGKYYICELNKDMISVKDTNNDGKFDMNDIHEQEFTNMDGHGYTEAPWLYRRKDENGNYYGKYYTFFASDWREQMSYAVSDDINSNTWEYKGVIMPRSATANTNHPSVIDFRGKTYFIYHNGMLTKGSGFRRSVCIEEMTFDKDGNVNPVRETSTGLSGIKSTIKYDGRFLGYNNFTNSGSDDDYPISKSVKFGFPLIADNTEWEIKLGKSGDSVNYISIQAVNKPGLYLCANGNDIVLTQDNDGKKAKSMTFKTVKGIFSGEGVSLESVSNPGYFVTASGDKLILTNGGYPRACEFEITNEEKSAKDIYINIKDISYDSENKLLKANYDIVNNSGNDIEAKIAAAVYTKDGEMKNIKLADKEKTAANSKSNKEIIIENIEVSSGNFLKLFAWENMVSQKPVCESIESNF